MRILSRTVQNLTDFESGESRGHKSVRRTSHIQGVYERVISRRLYQGRKVQERLDERAYADVREEHLHYQ